jgi:hypothetical protein
MRVPDDIKRCVVFFGLPDVKDGVSFINYKGTGFIVAIPLGDDGEGDSGEGFAYLITAKHSAEQVAGKEFVIRTNTTDGKSSVVLTAAADAEIVWYFHSTDKYADVAVLKWAIPPEADKRIIVVNSLVKAEDLKPDGIGIGDEVCIVGLFRFHEGHSKNHPLLRVGNIAMIPDEKVATKDGPMDAYLIEARSFGGVSGSPVFVAVQDRKPKPGETRLFTRWLLLGLIHGHWGLPVLKAGDSTQQKLDKDLMNMGIAIVTPAQKILDILYCDELSQERKKHIEQMSKNEHVVKD